MAVPTFDRFLLPLLQFASDGKDHHVKEAIEALEPIFDLSDADRAERLPSGKQTTFDNRVHWAKSYLKQACLLDTAGRGKFRITERGWQVLAESPSRIDKAYLLRFPEFVAFQARRPPRVPDASEPVHESQKTPQDLLQESYQALNDALIDDLVDSIMDSSPAFFEKLVMDLLLALGYGGAIEEAGEVIGRTGDNGVDVLIKEDKLGFDVIYVQAKRWDPGNPVGRPAVQAFAGSLMGQGAAKGVFVTTSTFTRDATTYAARLPQLKIILIDGQQLARLMIQYNVGVSIVGEYQIKKVDTDYFQE